MATALGNCGSSMLRAHKQKIQHGVCPHGRLIGMHLFGEASPLCLIECGNQDLVGAFSTSTAGNGFISSSDTEDRDTETMVESGAKMSGKFPCPHCFQKFMTEEALNQHDKCMTMPLEMVDAAKSGGCTLETVGLKLDGKIQCPDCKQKFGTEKALRLHCKYIHDGAEFNAGYTLVYEFDSSKSVDTSCVACAVPQSKL